MSDPAYQMMTLLCNVVHTLPVGTNLGLLHLLYMMVCGSLVVSGGAIIPGLHYLRFSDRAIRRAWQALRRGGWTIARRLPTGKPPS